MLCFLISDTIRKGTEVAHIHTRIHVEMYTYIRACMWRCTHTYTHTRGDAHIHTGIHVEMYTYSDIRSYVN